MSNRKINLQFDEADLPMLVQYLNLGATTAHMCGSENASRRMDQLKEMIENLIPRSLRLFEGEQFYEMATALSKAATWSIVTEYEISWSYKDKIIQGFTVVVDGTEFSTGYVPKDKRGDLPSPEQMFETLNRFASLDAEYTIDSQDRKIR
jgi:hypothetical protein